MLSEFNFIHISGLNKCHKFQIFLINYLLTNQSLIQLLKKIIQNSRYHYSIQQNPNQIIIDYGAIQPETSSRRPFPKNSLNINQQSKGRNRHRMVAPADDDHPKISPKMVIKKFARFPPHVIIARIIITIIIIMLN